MSTRTRVLVTNDDGIESPGLHSLAIAARDAGLDVVVAAPAEEASGSGAAITAVEDDGRISVEPRKLDGLEDIEAFAVAAAPALIALIACHEAFGDTPDVVLSGVNRGANLGQAILHSGTVGAALTAGVNGRRGLAVSLDVGLTPDDPQWDTASWVGCLVLPFLMRQPAGTVLNLNVPDVPPDQLAGLRSASLAQFGIVQTTMTKRGEDHVQLAIADTAESAEPGTDAAGVAEGYATITAIRPVCDRGPQTLDGLATAEGVRLPLSYRPSG